CPPDTAPSETVTGPASKMTIWVIAPVAAPVVEPMISGEPRALRDTDWNTAPDSPSAAPAKTVVTTRGRRISSTILEALSRSGPPVIPFSSAATTSPIGRDDEPTVIPTAPRTTAVTISVTVTVMVRVEVRRATGPTCRIRPVGCAAASASAPGVWDRPGVRGGPDGWTG